MVLVVILRSPPDQPTNLRHHDRGAGAVSAKRPPYKCAD